MAGSSTTFTLVWYTCEEHCALHVLSGVMSYVAALYVIVARCPGYGARWFSLIALLPAPIGRISSCADLLVA